MDELLEYIKRLEAQQANKPIWEKACLSIEEAAEYTGIGLNRLRRLVTQKKCPFAVPLGNQLFIAREKFEAFLDKKTSL